MIVSKLLMIRVFEQLESYNTPLFIQKEIVEINYALKINSMMIIFMMELIVRKSKIAAGTFELTESYKRGQAKEL